MATREQTEEKIKEYWGTYNLKPRISHQWKTRNLEDYRASVNSHRWYIKPNKEHAIHNILNENRISMLTGTMQMCVDHKLNKYEVPIFCINPPDSYSHELLEDKNLNYEYDDRMMEVSIRSTKYPNGDIKLSEKASC